MKTRSFLRWISAGLVALWAASCVISPKHVTPAIQPTPAKLAPPQASQAEIDGVVKANNQFACDFFAVEAKENKGNLFFSPYSLSSALAMTYAGARGQTAAEMARVLHLDQSANPHAAFAALTRQVSEPYSYDHPHLAVANALWGAIDCAFLPDYLARVQANFGELVDDRGGTSE